MINPIKQEDVMLTEQERLNAYRQMRSSIRNSEQYLVVGIDIAKEKHHALCQQRCRFFLKKTFTFRPGSAPLPG
jgi:hypothetical protein